MLLQPFVTLTTVTMIEILYHSYPASPPEFARLNMTGRKRVRPRLVGGMVESVREKCNNDSLLLPLAHTTFNFDKTCSIEPSRLAM